MIFRLINFLKTLGFKWVKSPFFYALLLILAYNLVAAITWGEHSIMCWTFQVLNYLIGLICFHKTKSKRYSYFKYFLPIWLIFVCTDLYYYPIMGFVYGFTYILLTPIVAYLAYISISKNWIYVMPAAILIYLNYQYIFPNSFVYFNRNIDNRLGDKFPKINLVDKDSIPVILENDKLIVLDFYSTYCGVCFKKFPEYERLKQRYKDNPNIKFYGIHVAYDKDTFSNSIKLLDKYSYTFSRLYSLSDKEIKDSLGFEKYPQLYLVKNGRIVYHGSLETNPNIKIDNTIDLIEKNLTALKLFY